MQRTSRDTSISLIIWLLLVSVMLVMIVMVGGITRLTDSGLSITEWQLIRGILPPLSIDAWQDAFALYRTTTEYQIVNSSMTLADFRFIYWWEWLHRFLARCVGILFFFPFLWFWVRGKLTVYLKKHLFFLLCLGSLQGIIGWWMVQSGLTDRVDVSHIRLTIHLFLASLIFVYTIHLIATLTPSPTPTLVSPTYHRCALVLLFLLFLQLILGALLAGLDGGLAYNTWPKMNDTWIPPALFQHDSFWLNLRDNPTMIQFLHRHFAFLVFLCFALHSLSLRSLGGSHYRRSLLLLSILSLQIVLGITTLLTQVSLPIALFHQLFAFLLLGVLTFHLQRLRLS